MLCKTNFGNKSLILVLNIKPDIMNEPSRLNDMKRHLMFYTAFFSNN